MHAILAIAIVLKGALFVVKGENACLSVRIFLIGIAIVDIHTLTHGRGKTYMNNDLFFTGEYASIAAVNFTERIT